MSSEHSDRQNGGKLNRKLPALVDRHYQTENENGNQGVQDAGTRWNMGTTKWLRLPAMANCNMPMIIAWTLRIRRVVRLYGFIFAIKCNQFFERRDSKRGNNNISHSLSVNQYRISFADNKAAEIVFTIAFLFDCTCQCETENGVKSYPIIKHEYVPWCVACKQTDPKKGDPELRLMSVFKWSTLWGESCWAQLESPNVGTCQRQQLWP